MDNDNVETVVEGDISQTMHELAATFDVSIPTVVDYLKQIDMVKKLDK